MHEVVYGEKEGYLLTLDTLRFAFDRISYDGRFWKILEVISTGDAPRVRVEESDDSYPDRLNDPVFAIPLNVAPGKKSENDTVVSLHGSTLDTEEPGMYVTPSRVVGDCIEDFSSFWYPLAEILDVFAEDFVLHLSDS